MYINYTYNCADLHAVTYVGCGWRSRPKENWGWCLVSFLIASWSVRNHARNSVGMTPGCEAGWLRLASAGGASLIDHGSWKAKGNDAESKNGNFWAVRNRLLVELLARARIRKPRHSGPSQVGMETGRWRSESIHANPIHFHRDGNGKIVIQNIRIHFHGNLICFHPLS